MLLMAAEYLDRKDTESDHGYASMLPCPMPVSGHVTRSDRRKSRLRHVHGARSSHNELEKNRRAHMKQCLNLLKSVVPLSGESNKHTTLGLLTNATSLIKKLREKERTQMSAKEQLSREHQYLRWKLDWLTSGQYRVRPSVSESSTTSQESSSSSLSSELDDVDVTGSEGDDQSSDSIDICGLAANQLVL